MPRYDYRCPSCNTVFEVEHGMREHPEVLCPTCGTPAIRQFKTSSIVFKGSGFYNTDQRGQKGSTKATAGKPANEESAAAAPAADAAESTGTESTAAASSDTAAPKDAPKESSAPKSEHTSSSSAEKASE